MCERGKVVKRVYIELKNLRLMDDINLVALNLPVQKTRDGRMVWQSARAEWLKWLDTKNDALKAPLIPANYRPARTVEDHFAQAVVETRSKYLHLAKKHAQESHIPFSMFVLMRVGIGFVHSQRIV